MYQTPESRKSAKVSIVKSLKDTRIHYVVSIETLLGRISRGETDVTLKFRRLKLIQDNILYQVCKKYDAYGFIAGEWKKREDSQCATYVPLMGFDIDHIELNTDGTLSDEYYRLFHELQMCEYVFACYPSLSGGIRFLVWMESLSIENHRYIYKEIVEFFSIYLKLPILISGMIGTGLDGSGNNPSRMWLFVPQNAENVYIDWEATPFPFTSVVAQSKIYTPIDYKIKPSTVTEGLFASQETQLMKHIDANLNKSYSGRNDRLFHLALRFRNNDVSMDAALDYCAQFIEKDFTIKEIETTIRSAYKIAKVQYSIAEATKYLQNQAR